MLSFWSTGIQIFQLQTVYKIVSKFIVSRRRYIVGSFEVRQVKGLKNICLNKYSCWHCIYAYMSTQAYFKITFCQENKILSKTSQENFAFKGFAIFLT